MSTQVTARRAPWARARLGPRFGWLWLATAATNLGDGLVLVAFPLLASQLSDQPLVVASVVVAAELPWLLVSLPFGAVVDRADRRRLLPRVELARAGLLMLLAVVVAADRASLPLLLLVAFSVGAGQTVVGAGTFAALPELVPDEELGRANGYLLATETATNNMAGPALGGMLFAAAAGLPFLLDGFSFALSALLLWLALPNRAAAPEPTARLRDDVREGWRAFAGDRALWGLAVVIAALAFAQALVLGILVLYVTDTLALRDSVYGVLLAVAAVAHMAGGLVGSRVDRALGSVRAIPAAALLAGLGYLTMGVAGSVVAATAGLVVEAVAVAIANVASLTLRQRLIPAGLLGRVGNIFRFFIFGTVPLGALAGGVLATWLGLRVPFLLAGALALATGALAAAWLRGVSRGRPTSEPGRTPTDLPSPT